MYNFMIVAVISLFSGSEYECTELASAECRWCDGDDFEL
jgi:hypothetical protein